MATKTSTQDLSNLVINKVESQTAYDQMVAAGQINPNELYLVEGDTVPSPYTSNPAMDGTASPGSSTSYAKGDHVHPSDTSRAPVSHATSTSTYGAGTGTNYGHLRLSDSTSSTSGTSGGYAATPAAVKSAYDLASSKQSPATTLAGYGITDAATSAELGTFVRPSLLDNDYFVGGGSQGTTGAFPINQRAETSYSEAEQSYCIDRWYKNANIIASLTSDALVLTRASSGGDNFNQQVENYASLAEKTLTLSVLATGDSGTSITVGYNDGGSNTYNTTYAQLSGTPVLQTFTFTVQSSPTNLRIIIRGNWPSTTAKINLIAAKLEVGSTQTLAHQENGTWVLNEIPNYEEQLARCQRFDYWIKVPSGSTNGLLAFTGGVIYGSTRYMNGSLYMPVPMRTTPSVTHASCDVYVFESASRVSLSDSARFSCAAMAGNVCLMSVQADSAMTGGQIVAVEVLAGGYIHFDANL